MKVSKWKADYENYDAVIEKSTYRHDGLRVTVRMMAGPKQGTKKEVMEGQLVKPPPVQAPARAAEPPVKKVKTDVDVANEIFG